MNVTDHFYVGSEAAMSFSWSLGKYSNKTQKSVLFYNNHYPFLADDVGSVGSVSKYEPLQRRARQNVVFELGFFFGLLGRGRVCAVYETGVQLPSDLSGLGRVEYDLAVGNTM